MNAIIGLSHFCEAHGPKTVFCTYATEDDPAGEVPTCLNTCTGCTSIGSDTAIVSQYEDGIIFHSTESVPNTELNALLKQAAVRSITCEVNFVKEGGVVCFGDDSGHVLGYNFQLPDSRARGLKRWFSIIALMKDKMLLQSVIPELSKHMKRISAELQALTSKVYNEEQNVCPQRALRLSTGNNDFGPSRSLKELTGDPNIFQILHVNFAWMILVAAFTYKETIYTSQDLLLKLEPSIIKGTIFEKNACNVSRESISVRTMRNMFDINIFRILLYCTLVGIKIIIKSDDDLKKHHIITCLENLLPRTTGKLPIEKSSINDRIVPCLAACTLQLKEGVIICNWLGSLPCKCPTLMNKIENALDNSKLSEDTLRHHLRYLQLEWLGIARSVKCALKTTKNANDLKSLKQVLGVGMQDEALITYWMNMFCL